MEVTESCMSSFLTKHEAKSIVNTPTCFKSINNPSCIDHFITNSYQSFQNTKAIATGLSDFHKMVVTVSKNTFAKSSPKIITYRNYKKFDEKSFKSDLQECLNLNSNDHYSDFESVFIETLNKHAPIKKKTIRANHVPYMNKTLRKAIMKRSELQTKYMNYSLP